MQLIEGMVSLPLRAAMGLEDIWFDGSKAVAVQMIEAELRVNVHLIADKEGTRMKRRFLVTQGWAGVDGMRHLISFFRDVPGDVVPWHVFVEDDGGCTVP